MSDHLHEFPRAAEDASCTVCGQTMLEIFGKGSSIFDLVAAAAEDARRHPAAVFKIDPETRGQP